MRWIIVRLSLVACMAGLMAAVPFAQGTRPSDTDQQTITRQQADEIIEQLKQIRLLLQRLVAEPRPAVPQPAAPQPLAPPPSAPPAASQAVTIPSLTGYMLGNPHAPLTMVEFTDLQCPFCRRFHETAFGEIVKNFIETGKLRYFSLDFPLNIHPLAMQAAEAARCAGVQGQFWSMRHVIFQNNTHLTPASFDTFAAGLKLNMTAFKACVAADTFSKAIAADQQTGLRAGVHATPTFIIGRTMGAGVVGVRIVGADPYIVFAREIRSLLGGR